MTILQVTVRKMGWIYVTALLTCNLNKDGKENFNGKCTWFKLNYIEKSNCNIVVAACLFVSFINRCHLSSWCVYFWLFIVSFPVLTRKVFLSWFCYWSEVLHHSVKVFFSFLMILLNKSPLGDDFLCKMTKKLLIYLTRLS